MGTGRVHVVGAGLAGLACATALAVRGTKVTLYEAAPRAGGRCRSFHDRLLDRRIDNGNHLVLGGNGETFRYLDRIGGRAAMACLAPARLPFIDLETDERWCLRPGAGPLPLWLLDPARRVPGAGVRDHAGLLRLALARPGATVAGMLGTGTLLWRRLWQPLAVSILNTRPDEACARLLWTVFRRTLLKGEAACRPWIARDGLSAACVDPALDLLARAGATVRLNTRLAGLARQGDRVMTLHLAGGEAVPLAPADRVVLALPAPVASDLLPGLAVPTAFRAILNAHLRLPAPVTLPGDAPLLGVVGGTVEWLFARGDVVSTTTSAADALIDRPAAELEALVWRDVARVLGLSGPCPPIRLVKEKRATFAATPDSRHRRPGLRAGGLSNLLLAGDWTDTGLPATIEGAVQSGHAAAAACG